MFCIFKENIRTWTEATELVDLGEKKLHNGTVYSNYIVKFYGRKSDELALVSLVGIYRYELRVTVNYEVIF